MPSPFPPAVRPRAAALAVAALLGTVVSAPTGLPPASGAGPQAAAPVTSVTVHRGGPDATVPFHRRRAGEAFLAVAVSARGVSWADRGNESAVVSAYVDGHYATDIVIPSSRPIPRRFALGSLRAGRHTLRLHYATRRSPSDAGAARLAGIRITTVPRASPEYASARFAPVLYGRDVAGLGGPFQNNRSDTPLVAWHRVLPAARPGHSVIEYSVMWSNEDGGTNTPALMAQWGRTTDIEWVYRVEIDARGRRVPGTGVIQSAAHRTTPFRGTYDGTHPRIQTCTSNNNVCSKVRDPMRFALAARSVLPAGQAREHEMDIHPWTYRVMALEMRREHKIESPPDPASSAMGDQRTYLYVAVDHDTEPPAAAAGIGLAVDVRLVGDPLTYSSNHDIAFWTINRDDPAATTVELPAGTTRADIASISVRRVPLLTDNGAALTVTHLARAFLLGRNYLPRPSFAHWRGSTSLTGDRPTAEIWPAG